MGSKEEVEKKNPHTDKNEIHELLGQRSIKNNLQADENKRHELRENITHTEGST